MLAGQLEVDPAHDEIVYFSCLHLFLVGQPLESVLLSEVAVALLTKMVVDFIQVLACQQLRYFDKVLDDVGLRSFAQVLEERLELPDDFLQVESAEQAELLVEDLLLELLSEKRAHLG